MNQRVATTVTIGLLAAASFLVTVYLIKVPIWCLFIAWASYVAAGGGIGGARRSVLMGIVGILSATVSLTVAGWLGDTPVLTAVCLVFGAGVLVALSALPNLDFVPASFFGFASTVGVIAVTGRDVISSPILTAPPLIVLCAYLLGTAFGYVADRISGALASTRRP